jgi:neutral ceramidase
MSSGYLVGRGIADVTGEAAGCGMLGYGKAHQTTAGIHLRLRARSFVIAETGPAAGTGKRVLLTVAELPLMFDGVRRAVLERLAARFGALYGEENVLLTVTHTHAGPAATRTTGCTTPPPTGSTRRRSGRSSMASPNRPSWPTRISARPSCT